MNQHIRSLLDQIQSLEEELRDAIQEQESKLNYRLEGARVQFDEAVKTAHRRLRTALPIWLARSQLRNVVSAPFIYSMIVPFALLDLGLWMYQAVCFRLYGIPRVERSRYIAIDRHHLAYLNTLQKLNCVYCGYANGLIAYAREITARTEQYWCPIKHARKAADTHSRYIRFLNYGEAEEFSVKTAELRIQLQREDAQKDGG